MIDIVFVTFNSEKWLEACIKSLADSEFDLKQVTLCFADNCSSDKTQERLESLRKCYGGCFGGFKIKQMERNLGFGGGNNAAVALGTGDYIFCLNVDTTVYRDTLKNIEEEVKRSPKDVGIWELRQFPYEHPKFYDPITRETSWCSGACFVIRRSLFEKIGGFDENIFMYGEDVDLSWRLRAQGYRLVYVPKAVVNHYCYQTAGEIKPIQFTYSLVNNLSLRLKFGDKKAVFWWCAQMVNLMSKHGPFPKARSQVAKAVLKNFPAYKASRIWHKQNRKKIASHQYRFLGWDYEIVRDGAFYVNERPEGNKKVSVLVRTCGRPDILRETLISLRNQTYPNIEVVIVEDGEAISERMIENEFADLEIKYSATGVKVGRCVAGNYALQSATGDYFNFLDDDDVFYPDHVETLVMELQRHPEYKIAYSLAFDTPITVQSQSPYSYILKGYYGHVKERFNRLELLHHNLFPIQAVMFSRNVFMELGGFDEDLDVLEDWNLWVRYASRYPFLYVEKTTSVYRVPADRKIDQKRQKELDEALLKVRQKQAQYELHWRGDELLGDYQAGIYTHADGARR